MATPIILDVGHSIDDLFAVALAACSPELHLIGVVTAKDEHGTRARLIRMLLDAYGRSDVPVAHGPGKNPRERLCNRLLDDLGRDALIPPPPIRSGVEALGHTLKEYGSVALAVTGPLTNVSSLLRQDPDAARHIERIYFAGGWITQALPEHNVRLDPEAAAHVIASGVPLTAFGYEVTRGYRLLRPHRMWLESATAPGPRLLHTIYSTWCQEDRDSAPGLLDPMVVTFLCGNAPARFETVNVAIETKGPGRGTMYQVRAEGHPIQVATKIDGSRYIDFLIRRVAPQSLGHEEVNPSHWNVHLRAVYRLEHFPGWSLNKTQYAAHVLVLIESGSCEIVANDQEWGLTAGSALYMTPEDVLLLTSRHGMKAYWFYFEVAVRDERGVAAPLERLPWPNAFSPLPDVGWWYAAARRVEQHWVQPWPESSLLCQGAFLELVASFCTRAEEQLSRTHNETSAAALEAKRWIEARVTEHVTLNDLAKGVSMSKYHLVRVFKEAFGVPPLQYHRRLKLEHAHRLLRLQHLSVQEVAARVGYHSTTAFTRAFKREYGVTPAHVQAGLG